MNKPWLLLSDLHAHKWSVFSTLTPEGMNSRLKIILDEIERAAAELKAAGGDTIVLAGDLFHERGSIKPDVFNPVHKVFERLCDQGFSILAIPGNHDLAGRDTTELGNAIQTLGALDSFTVITKPTMLLDPTTLSGTAYLPWIEKLDDLRAAVGKLKSQATKVKADLGEVDLVMHAGINGVLMGLPDHALDAAEVASWGFRRVFAGHYHNHKVLEGGKVISIGATTHQTFSDVDTKAGFLLVREDGFEYRASRAPSFVSITADTESEEIPMIVDGNYVRVREMELSEEEVKTLKAELTGMGAAGVIFDVTKKSQNVRNGSAPAKVKSLEGSIASFIGKQGFSDPAAVQASCLDILTAVRTTAT